MATWQKNRVWRFIRSAKHSDDRVFPPHHVALCSQPQHPPHKKTPSIQGSRPYRGRAEPNAQQSAQVNLLAAQGEYAVRQNAHLFRELQETTHAAASALLRARH